MNDCISSFANFIADSAMQIASRDMQMSEETIHAIKEQIMAQMLPVANSVGALNSCNTTIYGGRYAVMAYCARKTYYVHYNRHQYNN